MTYRASDGCDRDYVLEHVHDDDEQYYEERMFDRTLCEEPDEIWARCDEFPDYAISSKGRLWSTISNRFIKFGQNSQTGYLQAKLRKPDRSLRHGYLHRLVATAFVANLFPETKRVCRHLDDNRLNNDVRNLEWGDQHDNIEDCRRNGNMWTKAIITENIETGERRRFESGREAAAYLCCSPGMIVRAAKHIQGTRSTCGHYVWYEEELI